MFNVHARCVCDPQGRFQATVIERRDPGARDVVIDIAFAGICHSDIDHARSTRGKSTYPLVPGHEIAGVVSAVGDQVNRFKVGDRVGVGNMVDACGECASCRANMEQYCARRVLTYNAVGYDGRRTQGGYSEKIVVRENFVVRIPDAMPLDCAAPMLCAGITMYSPMRHWRVGPGTRVGIIGFGGLGHVGGQIAHAMGAHTTVLDLSAAKGPDALRLGADAFHLAGEDLTFAVLAGTFDLIISTVPVQIHLDRYLGLLALDGTLVTLSIPSDPLSVSAGALLANRRSIGGTRSGGIAETQEMLDFCAQHGIQAEVEVIDANAIDDAYQRLLKGDVRFRFVIDASTLGKS